MARFRKKPVEVEAVCWTGQNCVEIETFVDGAVRFGKEFGASLAILRSGVAFPSDFVLREGRNLFVVCSKEEFEAAYEPAGEAEPEEESNG